MKMSTIRNLKGRSSVMAVLLSLLFVFAVACGDDNNNNGTSNQSADAGNEDGSSQTDSGDQDGGDTGDQCTPLDESEFVQMSCSPVCQTGCESGEACYGGFNDNDELITDCQAAGEGGVAAPCSGSTECEAGLTCVNGMCAPFCDPSESECGDGGTCQGLTIEGGTTLPYGACAEDACTLTDQSTCPAADQACTYTIAGNQCVAFDSSATAGQDCTGPTTCNEGQICARITDLGEKCRDICDPANPDCPSGTTCGNVTSDGETLYTVCLPE